MENQNVTMEAISFSNSKKDASTEHLEIRTAKINESDKIMNTQKRTNMIKKDFLDSIENHSKVGEKEMGAIEAVIFSNPPIFPSVEPISDPFYRAFLSKKSGINQLDKLDQIKDHLLSPTPFIIDSKTGEINVGLSLISKTHMPLKDLSSLEFHYQVTLNDEGLAQLNIFVYYDDVSLADELFYWENIFEIYFPENSIPKILLSTIRTVKVFQAQGDPRASRGTVTTVKPPVN